MQTSALPEWRGLLLPVNDAAIAGSDLRADSDPANLFWSTRDLRHSARQLERGATSERLRHAQKLQIWQQIANNAHSILCDHSKDLDVAVWLVEAWTKIHGMQGVACGLAFFAAFIRQFWSDAFPTPETERPPADRVSAFAGLNGGNRPGALVDALFAIPVTGASDDEPFAYWHYVNAQQVQQHANAEHRERRIAEMGFSITDLHEAAQRTAADFYREARAATIAALAALDDIDVFLRQQLGDAAPATQLIRTHLAELKDIFGAFCPPPDDGEQAAALHKDVVTHNDAVMSTRQHSTSITSANNGCDKICSRNDAIQQLQFVANYFRVAEPHSPLAYGIDKLIRWAQLPFTELMRELITDANSRTQFHLMTGVDLDDAS